MIQFQFVFYEVKGLMLIAHAPAGYIVAVLLQKTLKPQVFSARKWVFIGVLGGLLPDFDMAYFYWVDGGAVHHHRYWTHFPVLWLLGLLLGLWWRIRQPGRIAAAVVLLCGINGFIHLLLDSMVGDVWWLMPWHDQAYALWTVTAVYRPWWLNFILHPSFLVEIGMCIWAVYLWRYRQTEFLRKE